MLDIDHDRRRLSSVGDTVTGRLGAFPHACPGFQCRICWWVWLHRVTQRYGH